MIGAEFLIPCIGSTIPRIEPSFEGHTRDEVKNAIIKNVAQRCLFECGMRLVSTGVTCMFIATPLAASYFTLSTITMLAINILCRVLLITDIEAIPSDDFLKLHEVITPENSRMGDQ